MNRLLLATAFWFLMAAGAHGRPHVLVLVGDGLTAADLAGQPAAMRTARVSGAACLVSPGLPRSSDPILHAYKEIGAGDTSDVDTQASAFQTALDQADVEWAVAGDASGDDTGPYAPLSAVLGRNGAPPVSCTVPSPLMAGGRIMQVSACAAFWQQHFPLTSLVVIHDGDMLRIEREDALHLLTARVQQSMWHGALARFAELATAGDAWLQEGRETGDARILIILSATPRWQNGSWSHMPPCIMRASDASYPPDSLLFSSTTRRPGLLAQRDLAPTLLAMLSVPVPVSMSGASARAVPASTSLSQLAFLDRTTDLVQRVQSPLFWTLGMTSGLGAFFALAGILWRPFKNSPLRLLFSVAIRFTAAWPLVLLATALLPPMAYFSFGICIVGVSLLLAACLRAEVLYVILAAALAADAVTGTHLVAASPLSAYLLSGIRFYGIGNEYMGLLLGSALCAAGALWRCSSAREMPARVTLSGVWLAAIACILVYPAFGAKAGGAVTAAVAFVVWLHRIQGRPVTIAVFGKAVAWGVGLLLAATVVGRIMHASPTHVDVAVTAVSKGRVGYILLVALRKASLALQVALHPGTLAGIGGFCLLAIAGWRLLRRQLAQQMHADHALWALAEAGCAGAGVSCLVNDSGIVCAILLLSVVAVTLIDRMLDPSCELSPSMLETSESA